MASTIARKSSSDKVCKESFSISYTFFGVNSLEAVAYLEEKRMVDAVRGKLEAEMEELKETKEKLEKSYKRAEELKAEESLLEDTPQLSVPTYTDYTLHTHSV